MTASPPATGFDVLPSRPAAVTAVLFVAVMVASAAIAYVFRRSAFEVLELFSGFANPATAAGDTPRIVVFAVVSAAVGVAAVLGQLVNRHWPKRVGIEAVAASARGEGRSISLPATGVRLGATWLVSTAMVSIGRESAIIESSGAVGASVARHTRGRGDAMAAAAMAAGFAAAYHSPIAAALYVEEHLGVRRSRRAVIFTLLGAACGHVTALLLFDSKPIFPSLRGSAWDALLLGLIAVVPAVLVARLFLHLRVRVHSAEVANRIGCPNWCVVACLSVIAGASVAVFPDAAGNGMEGLRQASVGVTVAIGVALLVGKLVGTTAALGAGAPGGVITPTIAMVSGVALLTFLAIDGAGFEIIHPWDGIVAVMAVGVAVGIRAPLVGIFLIPELVGDYWLVPVVAVIVAIAVALDRLIDIGVLRLGGLLPTGVYDEDA